MINSVPVPWVASPGSRQDTVIQVLIEKVLMAHVPRNKDGLKVTKFFESCKAENKII